MSVNLLDSAIIETNHIPTDEQIILNVLNSQMNSDHIEQQQQANQLVLVDIIGVLARYNEKNEFQNLVKLLKPANSRIGKFVDICRQKNKNKQSFKHNHLSINMNSLHTHLT